GVESLHRARTADTAANAAPEFIEIESVGGHYSHSGDDNTSLAAVDAHHLSWKPIRKQRRRLPTIFAIDVAEFFNQRSFFEPQTQQQRGHEEQRDYQQ